MSSNVKVLDRLRRAGAAPSPALPHGRVAVARDVQELRPYEAVSSLDQIQAKPWQTPLKLDWNESTIPPSPRVIERITAFLQNTHHLNWYPDLAARRLVEALSRYTRRSASQLLVTNGSDDALDLICKTYLDHDERVLLPYPTYTHFLVYAGAQGARFDPVTYDDPFVPQLERIINALTPWTKLVYLVNPNNPTGVLYSPDEVETLLRLAPHTLFVVDEAYFEFAGSTAANLVDSYRNLIVTRTFSKSFGIAGLRVGYLMANAEVVQELRRVHNPKSVNVLGQIAATAALGDSDYLQAYLAEVAAAKEILVRALLERGIEARNTSANWILARVQEPERFCAALAEEGVYIRNRSSFPQLNGYVRISLGTRAQLPEILTRLDQARARLVD
ncbi:MAG: histidinol-phosphate transaminase [Myxococcota bacterium]|jgi:histidinol-phosphate aminotransferase|nr:histidinol-phosphate transaminase [Myxococcota bacterium]